MALAAGCSSGRGGFEVADGDFTSGQIQVIETMLGAALPESAVAGETRAKLIAGGLDDALMLRLKMPTEEVAPFLDTIGMDEPLRDGFAGVVGSGSEPDWFRTGGLTDFTGASTLADKAIEVTVDVSDPAHSTLYLRVFEV